MSLSMAQRHGPFGYVVLSLVLVLGLVSSVAGQALQQSPYGGPDRMRNGGLDLVPSNPLAMPGSAGGLPRGSDSVFLSSGMFRDLFPLIPNLEIGYLHTFGKNVRNSRLTLDYVLPIEFGQNSAVFGEAHGEFTNFWKSLTCSTGFKERSDVSAGGGYRRIFHDDLFLGVNAFYDASRLGERWYGSGGLGLEMASLLPGNDMVDLNFNYYGNLFQGRNSIVNTFRNGTGNFDIEAGYSHELYGDGPDLRLKVTGYQFDVGAKVYGWNVGAEVSTRNGLFTARADTGNDRFNGTYHTVGGFVNIGLQLERLLSGESPFLMPEPIFKSPRNLRRLLSRKVRRNWHQPAAVVATESLKVAYVWGIPSWRVYLYDSTIMTRETPTIFPVPVKNLKAIEITVTMLGHHAVVPSVLDVNVGVSNAHNSIAPGVPYDPMVIFNRGGLGRLPSNAPNDTTVTYWVTPTDLANMKSTGKDLISWCTGGTGGTTAFDTTPIISVVIKFYE